MARAIRIGQIVPSSNTTMETEVPAMLRAREAIRSERFTFHSSRMRMRQVTKDELAAMEFMLDKMKNTKSNDEFFNSMKRG